MSGELKLRHLKLKPAIRSSGRPAQASRGARRRIFGATFESSRMIDLLTRANTWPPARSGSPLLRPAARARPASDTPGALLISARWTRRKEEKAQALQAAGAGFPAAARRKGKGAEEDGWAAATAAACARSLFSNCLCLPSAGGRRFVSARNRSEWSQLSSAKNGSAGEEERRAAERAEKRREEERRGKRNCCS